MCITPNPVWNCGVTLTQLGKILSFTVADFDSLVSGWATRITGVVGKNIS